MLNSAPDLLSVITNGNVCPNIENCGLELITYIVHVARKGPDLRRRRGVFSLMNTYLLISMAFFRIFSLTISALRPWSASCSSVNPPLLSPSFQVANLTTKFNKNFNKTKFTDFFVDGVKAGQFKQSGNFAYLRVYGAGEEVSILVPCHSASLTMNKQVPAYGWQNLKPGQAALQFFNYSINDHSLSRAYSRNEFGIIRIWISLVVIIYCSMTVFDFVF